MLLIRILPFVGFSPFARAPVDILLEEEDYLQLY